MIGHRFTLGAAAVLASAAFMGCSQEIDAPQQEVDSVSEAILNGTPAVREDKYGAVAALVYYLPEVGVVDTFCSGTLVAKKSVVTARHCTQFIDLARQAGLVPAVAFGADVLNPSAVVPITGYVNAPRAPGNEQGLLKNGGRDVAVAHLESRPVGIRPAKLERFDNDMIGDRFEIAGYGVNNTQGFYGSRYAGRATARAIRGRWYELLFKGDYAAYLNWYFTDSPSAARTEAEAKEWWKSYKLENNYELLAGGLRGEAIACNGDSGGPLLRGTCAGDMAVYGVSFAVENSISTLCTRGSGYLVFNRKMLDFVRDNI